MGEAVKPPSPLEKFFGRLGWFVGKHAVACIGVVLAIAWSLASGLFAKEHIVDADLFDSLLLRPGTRLQRESDWVVKYEDEGYSTGSEATNARATRGGKNVLTRKNLLQVAEFFADAGVHSIEIEHRGVTYGTREVLSFAGPSQPYRFTVLDCFQEGSYDYEGDVDLLGSSLVLVHSVVDEIMGPFLPSGQTSVPLTPYNWCLYLRAGIVYAPNTAFDEATFGRCRQFLKEEPPDEYAPLAEFYDFHRFLAFDWARSSPSSFLPWGCKVEILDQTRCHPVLSCCETSRAYAACAACEATNGTSAKCSGQFAWEDPDPGANATSSSMLRLVLPSNVSEASCDALRTLLDIDSWRVNPEYSDEYASQAACAAFDYYPLSTLYAGLIGAVDGAQLAPESRDFADCSERLEVLQRADQDDPDAVTGVVEYAGLELYCKQFGGDSTCPTQLDADDFDWRFKQVAVATEAELNERAASGTCAHWDGGPDGSQLLPYIGLQVILGDIERSVDPATGQVVASTKALQTVQPSNGYKVIRDNFRADPTTPDVSTRRAKEGREAFLTKYSKVMHGRHDGGSMVFGSYSSGGGGAAARSSEAQLVPETELVVVAYALILVYTIFIVCITGGMQSRRRALLDAGLAVIGVVMVFSGLIAGVGMAIYAGIDFNPVSVQVLPFLILGLGINDLYVFTHRHLELLGALHSTKTVVVGGGPGIAARVAADAGASVTITTSANVCVFVVAAIVIKMRMIANFSLMAACALAGTWFSVIFGFTAVLSVHATLALADSAENNEDAASSKSSIELTQQQQQQQDSGDGDGAIKAATADEEGEEPSSDAAKLEKALSVNALAVAAAGTRTMRRQQSTKFANALTGKRMGAMAIVAAFAAAFATVIGLGIPEVELNYAVNYIFQRRSPEDIFWRTKLKHLPANFFDLHTGESDYPRKHPLLASTPEEGPRYSLMDEVGRAKKVNTGQESWYNVFITWCYPCGTWSFDSPGSETDVQAKCAESEWYAPLSGAYNSRCSANDPQTEPPGACGPVVSAQEGAYLGSDRFRHADLKAALYSDPDNDLSTPLVPACSAWPVQSFLCDGGPCFGPDELTPELYAQVVANETLVYGVHPDYYYYCFNLMQKHDEAHVLRSPVFSCYDPDKPTERLPCSAIPPANRSVYRGRDGTGDMVFSQTIVWARGLKTGENWLKFIRSLRRKLNAFVSATKLDAYPHGSFFTFYYQFTFIRRVMVEAFGYSALLILGLTFTFFVLAQDPASAPLRVRFVEAAWLAVLTLAGVLVQIVTFIALMGLTDIWLNCFTLATVIVSFGIAIEATAHTAFGYLAAEGLSHRRATESLKHYFLPITDGAFTTFLGFAPISASRYLYVVIYYFCIYAMLVFLAYIVGVVVFPCILAAFGRNRVALAPAESVVLQNSTHTPIKQQESIADDRTTTTTTTEEDQAKRREEGKRPGTFEMEVDL